MPEKPARPGTLFWGETAALGYIIRGRPRERLLSPTPTKPFNSLLVIFSNEPYIQKLNNHCDTSQECQGPEQALGSAPPMGRTGGQHPALRKPSWANWVTAETVSLPHHFSTTEQGEGKAEVEGLMANWEVCTVVQRTAWKTRSPNFKCSGISEALGEK